MLKKIMIASLAVGALALNAPIAQAAPPADFGCSYDSVAQETATGGQDTFTGAAFGYIIGDASETSVSISCEVRVNGATQAATPAGTGTVAATSQGQVTYTATDSDDVDLCSVWSTSTDSGVSCGDATSVQFPPQAVIDALTLVFDTINDVLFTVTSIPDPTICPIFASLAPGVPGVVDISSEGDITLPDPLGKFWDCPPYDPPVV